MGLVTRRAVRDRIRSEKVMERVVRDIQRLLVPEELPEEMLELDVVGLCGMSRVRSSARWHELQLMEGGLMIVIVCLLVR